MLFGVYSVRDRTAEVCGPLFVAKNDGVATRSFLQMVVKVVEWDRDAYQLLYFGSFDDELAVLSPEGPPRIVEVEFPKLPKEVIDDSRR